MSNQLQFKSRRVSKYLKRTCLFHCFSPIKITTLSLMEWSRTFHLGEPGGLGSAQQVRASKHPQSPLSWEKVSGGGQQANKRKSPEINEKEPHPSARKYPIHQCQGTPPPTGLASETKSSNQIQVPSCLWKAILLAS